MSGRRRWLSVPVTLAAAAALAALSGVPVRWYPDAAAELRLSWSARPERLEVCRERTDAELAERPAHMRQRMECEGRSATYALTVLVDDDTLEGSVIQGSGMRQDRPVHLLRRHPVGEGTHRVRVRLVRREERTEEERRERREHGARVLESLPPRAELDTVVSFQRAAAVLVTYRDGAIVVQAASPR
ncbi:MAG: hypothetical protein IPJ78_12220 [Gemmatimonadetes bacterium]|jgi:hypothetical protein|nr:hypothetical protein [Gemmatimonadota bacterium]MBP7551470.1 hypothetical protein [Gemmatimonadaceae bacterium]